MYTQIALVRGINVGGHNRITMTDLRQLCEEIGFSHVQSVLQSGNLVLRGGGHRGATLERLLERVTSQRLGVSCDYMVRSGAEVSRIIHDNPFPQQAIDDPSHLLVMFLKTPPTNDLVKSLRDSITGPELISAKKRDLYIVYPHGIANSKLTGTRIERAFDAKGTARNWNTILKMQALCQASR